MPMVVQRLQTSEGYSVLSSQYKVRCGTAVYAALIAIVTSVSAADEAPPFSEIRALFAAKCLACHGNDPKELKGEYDLRTRAPAIKGGESGEAAILPGLPDKSPLYRAITW